MTEAHDLTDAELLRRFSSQGDREALGALFRRHAGFAFRTAHLILKEAGAAEDVVQEAFLQVLRQAPGFDPARPFQPWFRAVVAHTALKHLRTSRRRDAREAQAIRPDLVTEEPTMAMIDRETRSRLRTEVEALPEDLRLPVELHYQAGYSYKEVARALGCPEGTVATRLAAARERIKIALVTAGVLLAAGTSLEEALAAAGPLPAPVPPGLLKGLEALAARAPTLRHAAPAAGMRWRKPALLSAGALLLLIGIGTALRPGKSPAMPRPPEPAVTSVVPVPAPIPVQEPGTPSLPDLAAASPEPEPAAETGTASVHGTVTWKGSGRPIHGAWVIPGFLRPEGDPERENSRCMAIDLGVKGPDEGEPAAPPVQLASLWEQGPAARTGEDGSFVLAGLPTGKPYKLFVEPPASLGAAFAGEEYPADDPSGQPGTYPALQAGQDCQHDVTLQADIWSVRARILRPDGSLVPEGGFFFRNPAMMRSVFGGPFAQRDDALGPDGRYEIVRGLDLRQWPIEKTILFLNVPGFPVEDLPLATLRQDPIGCCFLVDLTLRKGRSIQGTVLGPDGRGVPGATVYGWNVAVLPVAQSCTTGDDGSFRIEGLPEGKPLGLWAQHAAPPGALAPVPDPAAMEQPLEIPEGGPGPFTLRLDARGEVSGRVLVDGKPMADVLVSGRLPDGVVPLAVLRMTRTDSEGHYVFGGLPHWKGDLRVRLMQDVGIPREERARSVPVGSKDVDFVGKRSPEGARTP